MILFDDVLERYLKYGGMPAIASLSTTQEAHSLYLSGLYDAVVTRDILNRERIRERNKVVDPVLLERVTAFLADNIGNKLSMKSIADTLTSAGTKTTNKTVDSYVTALDDAYLFYKADRYDLHGKEILRTNPKRYIVDLGLRSFLASYRTSDMGRSFEKRRLSPASLSRGGTCTWESSTKKKWISSPSKTEKPYTSRLPTRCSRKAPENASSSHCAPSATLMRKSSWFVKGSTNRISTESGSCLPRISFQARTCKYQTRRSTAQKRVLLPNARELAHPRAVQRH